MIGNQYHVTDFVFELFRSFYLLFAFCLTPRLQRKYQRRYGIPEYFYENVLFNKVNMSNVCLLIFYRLYVPLFDLL